MSENKLDRANLRRQAQRVESYKTLISRQRSTFKNPYETANSESTKFTDHDYEFQDEQYSKGNHISSPGSSTPGFSSDSSQDFQPNLCTSLKAIQNMPYQSEVEVSSVMTRSATRKYATVGAIHNRVNIDKELKIIKQWPINVSYLIPKPLDNLEQLRDIVTRSFSEVLSFCKTAITPENEESETMAEESDMPWTPEETAERFIDLTPYLTREPVLDSGSHENSITFHLNEDYMAEPFMNIIALNEQDQDKSLVIHEEVGGYETITLHSGESYLVDNKYLSNSNLTEFSPENAKTFSRNAFPDDLMVAIHNDHTYAAKSNQLVVERDQKPPSPDNEQNGFKLEKALNDLLLNTAILKCLVCNETPQEIMSQLDIAQSYL